MASITCLGCNESFTAHGNKKLCLKCCPDRKWLQPFYLYGLTKPKFDELLEKQKGLCDFCELPLPINNLSQVKIDHCHLQGHVRGLLHHRCNVGLHFIEDDKFLAYAVRYIERHRI